MTDAEWLRQKAARLRVLARTADESPWRLTDGREYHADAERLERIADRLEALEAQAQADSGDCADGTCGMYPCELCRAPEADS